MLDFPDDPQVLRKLEVILERTPLRTAALWMTGSSVAHEEIVRRRIAEGDDSDFDHYLGASGPVRTSRR